MIKAFEDIQKKVKEGKLTEKDLVYDNSMEDEHLAKMLGWDIEYAFGNVYYVEPERRSTGPRTAKEIYIKVLEDCELASSKIEFILINKEIITKAHKGIAKQHKIDFDTFSTELHRDKIVRESRDKELVNEVMNEEASDIMANW